jgi:hypothetical protein
MYTKILRNDRLPLMQRVKWLISYYRARRAAALPWKKRHKIVFGKHPGLKSAVGKDVEQAHRAYWKPIRNGFSLDTLRVCSNISGIPDPAYIPEELFFSDIEPTLNPSPAVAFYNIKSFYNQWFPRGIFPRDYLHNIDGEWLDHDLKPVTPAEITAIAGKLDYPVVVKPNTDTHGGKNVHFPKDAGELLELLRTKKNVLVQEMITQHPFFRQFNAHGINTLRVNIYRSVTDHEPHVVNVVLRMGVGGSLDNETAGGIVCMVRKDGRLNGYAVDKHGAKYLRHPDTNTEFNQVIPDYQGLIDTALQVARRVFHARLICLDLCYDADQKWRMIEININGTTIRFAQYHGARFFAEYTDEVRDFCLSNHWSISKS